MRRFFAHVIAVMSFSSALDLLKDIDRVTHMLVRLCVSLCVYMCFLVYRGCGGFKGFSVSVGRNWVSV